MCTPSDALRTYAGLRAAGLTRREIERRVQSGLLTRLRRGVYAATLVCEVVATAATHGGPLACVTAARHVGLWVLDEPGDVHVWLRAHGHAHIHDDCTCTEHWDGEGPTTSFATPSVPRILRQILFCRGVETFFVALESARRQRLITAAGIAWLRANTTPAAHDAIVFSRSDADSGLESLMRWRLRRLGLRMRSQVTIVSVGRVDFLIGDRLIIEVDGKANHDGHNRHKDLRRDANAAAWGYVTLRFDYAQVVHDWETVELAILRSMDLVGHMG